MLSVCGWLQVSETEHKNAFRVLHQSGNPAGSTKTLELSHFNGEGKDPYTMKIKMNSGDGIVLGPDASSRANRTRHRILQMRAAKGFAANVSRPILALLAAFCAF